VTRPTLSNWQYEENRGYSETEMPLELWDAEQAVLELEKTLERRRRERRDRQSIPEILYHYTDVHGLHGMLSSFKLWLSDASYMNDPLEGTWVHRRAVTIADKALGGSPLSTQIQAQIAAQLSAPDLWDMSVRGAGTSEVGWAAFHEAFTPAFITSFTENGDLLSQWRGYGGGGDGVSVGFDVRKLEFCQIEYMPGSTTKPTLLKVEYDEQAQDDEVIWMFCEIRRAYEDHADILALNPHAAKRFIQLIQSVTRDALYWLRWEFKSPCYSEEKEWRLLATPFGLVHPKFRVSNGHIVPYLEMPLPQVAARPINRLAISRIILGPRCQQSVLRSVRILLQNLAYPEVIRSRLSLR
jgi:hypothetical protein